MKGKIGLEVQGFKARSDKQIVYLFTESFHLLISNSF